MKVLLSVMLTLVLGICSTVQADSISLLSSFSRTNGASPFGSLIQIGSTLYGTTQGGGTDYGTVFSIPIGGGSPTVLTTFNGSNGSTPRGSLIQIGQTLYGTTMGGGSFDCGTVFSIPIGGGSPTVLTTFNGSNGSTPRGSLIQIGQTLYGTTQNGGAYGNGTVFSLPVSGGTPTILTSFTDANGSQPMGSLLQVGSTFYGTTMGGGSNGLGTVFSIPVSGGAPTILASFNYNNGSNPYGSLILIGSTLYGTTQGGGTDSDGSGLVFSVPVDGGAITVLGEFNGVNGSEPDASLTLSANGQTLYGTTAVGGSNETGVLFSLPVSGGNITVLNNFQPSGAVYGAHPNGSLLLVDSTLYGTAADGGNGYGTVYAYNLTSVPEPSTGLLVFLGVAGLLGVARNTKRA